MFFNGGLRKDAKFLYLNVRDGLEKRIRIVEMEQLGEQQDLLDQVGLVLQATGFAARLPPIYKQGAPSGLEIPPGTGNCAISMTAKLLRD